MCFSLLTEADAGHTDFMDEVYQNETRFPGGEWKAASEPFTDVVSERHPILVTQETEERRLNVRFCVASHRTGR